MYYIQVADSGIGMRRANEVKNIRKTRKMARLP
jgi:hypothetical protein